MAIEYRFQLRIWHAFCLPIAANTGYDTIFDANDTNYEFIG